MTTHPSLTPASSPPTPQPPAAPTPPPAPSPATEPEATALWVEAWPDPVVDALGHDPRSQYVETYWLGVLGPSTTWLLRRLADSLDRSPQGFHLDLHDTALALGLGMRKGRSSPFIRAIDRACQFGLARRIDAENLVARRRIPPVTQGQLKRLSPGIQQAHAEWQHAQLHATDTQDRKARRLALTLLEIGEDVDAAERQLQAWRIDGTVAQRAIHWAHNRHSDALAAAESSPPDAA